MGSIITTTCTCDTPFGQMFLGGGMMDMGTKFYAPYYCDECGTIKRRNILKKYHRCGKCKKKLTLFGEVIKYELKDRVKFNFDDPSKYILTMEIGIDRMYVLENKLYSCPACKSEHLEFADSGLWD